MIIRKMILMINMMIMKKDLTGEVTGALAAVWLCEGWGQPLTPSHCTLQFFLSSNTLCYCQPLTPASHSTLLMQHFALLCRASATLQPLMPNHSKWRWSRSIVNQTLMVCLVSLVCRYGLAQQSVVWYGREEGQRRLTPGRRLSSSHPPSLTHGWSLTFGPDSQDSAVSSLSSSSSIVSIIITIVSIIIIIITITTQSRI